MLLISELGYISFFNPKKAQEIKTGALNTVHKGNIVIIESTHEGGKYGVNYDMIKVAQESPADPPALTETDWRFHFFAWWQDPNYTLHDESVEFTAAPRERGWAPSQWRALTRPSGCPARAGIGPDWA